MPTDAQPCSIFNCDGPRIFSISPGQDFLRSLSHGLHRALAAHPDTVLADVKVYLPTRRAKRALAKALVETAPGGSASLLPQIYALGDIDEDEIHRFDGHPIGEIEIPPAISMEERQIALASLVAAQSEAFRGQKHWAASIAAAGELAKLLDALNTNEVAAHSINDIVPDTLAEHWRHSKEFLQIVTKTWPNFLAERNLTDPSRRRIQLINLQNDEWQASPPEHPIIVAGTTGSTPAVARLIKTVASLPMGGVVLPGIDLWSSQEMWESTGPSHPQFGLKQLIAALDIDRDAVKPWHSEVANTQTERTNLFSVALRPAIQTDSWLKWAGDVGGQQSALATALDGIELIEASDEDREASAIALKIREAVEDAKTTISFVTPNRELSRRVIQKLTRWNIFANDSAGIPLASSPCGAFLRLVSQWLADPLNAVSLLAIVRHPLFSGGVSASDRNKMADALDLALRGLSASGEKHKFAVSYKHRISLNTRTSDTTREQAIELVEILSSIAGNFNFSNSDFKDQFEAFVKVAEDLAASDELPGAEILWRGEDGEAAADALSKIKDNLHIIKGVGVSALPDILLQLISSVTVRARAAGHPRLNIFGPLEARLQYADLVILGGLNEGVWPRDGSTDPFLSHGMRRDIGLSSIEEKIGLAAHDFVQLAAAPKVVLTRSQKSDGKPTTPSRWVVRLKNILRGAGAEHAIDRSAFFEFLARRMDEPATINLVAPPAPKPPVEARPKDFFVTHIEKYLRDPYGIYAKHILRLRKLDNHNEQFDQRHIGNLFHKVFEEFVAASPDVDHDGAVELLTQLFHDHAGNFGMDESRLPFWRERAISSFDHFARWDRELRQTTTSRVLERKGAAELTIDGTAYTLSAYADRIDIKADGSAVIIDYKTGDPPPSRNESEKFNPQLPLTGYIVASGGFDDFGATNVSIMNYIRVLIATSGPKAATGWNNNTSCATVIEEAREGFQDLVRHFANPDNPYLSQPRPKYMDSYGDYDHLARRRERNAHGEAE